MARNYRLLIEGDGEVLADFETYGGLVRVNGETPAERALFIMQEWIGICQTCVEEGHPDLMEIVDGKK